MKKLIAAVLFLLPFSSLGETVQETVLVQGVRMWPAPDHTRLVFDVSGPTQYRLFDLEHPPRIVIDLKKTRLRKPLVQPGAQDKLIRRIRSGVRKGGDLRVVLDLHDKASYKSFLLKPNAKYGYRLVIDVQQLMPSRPLVARKVTDPARAGRKGVRDVVIAIDAGHGGEDPGARGYSGVYEKDVVLAIARRLARLVEQERGMRPVLIRDGDYFVSLRERTRLARRHKADFYISIHADAFHDRRVRGMSVYALSSNGASDEAARWLAEKENASDLIGGVSLDDKDEMLVQVLLDLSQTATIESSLAAGGELLRHMRPLGKLHKKSVQQARFVVLKSPDIPSVLVETAFISNPSDERNLRNPRYQQALARALLKGIRSYFTKNPPPGTYYAATRRHVIARGDTLSQLAAQYHVSLAALRAVNGIEGDKLRVGQVIRIPVENEG